MTVDPPWLHEVGGLIEAAIARRDTRHAIFHGCYDWHSAVHGHWALLRLSRVLGEPRFAAAATAALTPERVAIEARLLRDQPGFELPYGRAWFLRLAIEHAIATGGDALAGMAAELARSLVDHYDRVAPSPASREYASASWALVQLHAWARHAGDATLAGWVAGQVEAHFLEPGEVPGFDHDRRERDFFSPRAGWLYLIARTQPPATLARVLDAAALDHRQLAPVRVTGAAHHYGVNWSRAWMLHRLAILDPGTALYREAFAAHVETGLADHARAVGDYHAYGHWVPQFAVHALTEDAA